MHRFWIFLNVMGHLKLNHKVLLVYFFEFPFETFC